MQTTGDKVLELLKGFDLKTQSNGQYRSNSPLRPGSNSHGFLLRIDSDGEHGAFQDKVTYQAGSLYSLAEQLGIEVPRQKATETKREYKDLAEYALAHGVGAEVFAAAGWKECEQHDVDGNLRRALSYPTQNGVRFRFLDQKGKAVYHSPAGYKNCWYGLKRAVDLARKRNMPLVICNGAPSVVVAQHYNVAACALSGGGQKIPAPLLEELRAAWQGGMIIAMDCDSEGQHATYAYHEQLPKASIVDLGLTARGDLADFCALYTDVAGAELQNRAVKFEFYEETQDTKALAESIGQLIAARKGEGKTDVTMPEILDKAQREIDLLRQKEQPTAVLSFRDLIAQNRKTLEERRKNPGTFGGLATHILKLDRIVGNWQPGRLHVIYGDTNMGKSTLAVSIVCDWLRQGAGVIFPTESPPNAYMNKLVACMCQIPYDLIDEGRLDTKQYTAVADAMDKLEAMDCHILDAGSPTPSAIGSLVREGVRKHGYKWVLVDSMSKMKIAGTNNIYDTTRIVSDSLQDLAREANITMLVTCQVGRSMKERKDKTPLPNDALGAGTVEQNADVILSLYNHNHYVRLGVLEPDEKFPADTALVKVIKHRWKDTVGHGVMLKFIGGSGFYEYAKEGELIF